MAIILDIAGKPLPARNHSKRLRRAQNLRDLMKILIILSLIILGYFMFVPHQGPAQSSRATPPQDVRAG